MEDLSDGHVFGFGNPMIDITAVVTDDFLKKYGLAGNSTVLADPDHEGIIEDVTESFEIDYSTGGATQNTLRYITWVIGADIATFAGHLSDDYFGRMIQACVKRDGLRTVFTIKKTAPTGTCLALISEDRRNRTLIASLGAASKFTKEDLLLNWFWAEQAAVYFLSGHGIAVSPESAMLLARETTRDQFNPKKLVLNIGAPYVCEKFSADLKDIFPFVDLVFANENQARAFAKMQGHESTSVKEIAKMIANEFKKTLGQRMVVITRGSEPVLVAKGMDPKVMECHVPKVPVEEIVDTNAAGDAFAGGFVSQWIMKKPLATCIKCAFYCAEACLKTVGCSSPKHPCQFVE